MSLTSRVTFFTGSKQRISLKSNGKQGSGGFKVMEYKCGFNRLKVLAILFKSNFCVFVAIFPNQWIYLYNCRANEFGSFRPHPPFRPKEDRLSIRRYIDKGVFASVRSVPGCFARTSEYGLWSTRSLVISTLVNSNLFIGISFNTALRPYRHSKQIRVVVLKKLEVNKKK